MHTRSHVLAAAIAMVVLSGCTKSTSPTQVATAADFVGSWSGNIPVSFHETTTTDTGTFRTTISLAPSGDSLTGTWTIGIENARAFSSLGLANGVASFSIPLPGFDVGAPGCDAWSMHGVALLDQSRQNMTVTLSGTVCGLPLGATGTIDGTGILTKS